jgi:hypothetical protein
LRIVIEFDAGANFEIRIRRAQFIDLVKIDSGMETIVIGKGNVTQTPRTRTVDPGLQQFSRIRLNAMSLRMGMVIGKKLHGGSPAPRAMLNKRGSAA